MTKDEIVRVRSDFAAAAKRALAVGFEWLEVHFAHGYLGQSFFSPIANKRTDEYGGSFENRIRFLIETFSAVREVWPERLPLTIRLGISDFNSESQPIEESIELIKRFKALGLDLIDVSIGFNTPDVSGVPWGPGFMVPFAERIKREADICDRRRLVHRRSRPGRCDHPRGPRRPRHAGACDARRPELAVSRCQGAQHSRMRNGRYPRPMRIGFGRKPPTFFLPGGLPAAGFGRFGRLRAALDQI